MKCPSLKPYFNSKTLFYSETLFKDKQPFLTLALSFTLDPCPNLKPLIHSEASDLVLI